MEGIKKFRGFPPGNFSYLKTMVGENCRHLLKLLSLIPEELFSDKVEDLIFESLNYEDFY